MGGSAVVSVCGIGWPCRHFREEFSQEIPLLLSFHRDNVQAFLWLSGRLARWLTSAGVRPVSSWSIEDKAAKCSEGKCFSHQHPTHTLTPGICSCLLFLLLRHHPLLHLFFMEFLMTHFNQILRPAKEGKLLFFEDSLWTRGGSEARKVDVNLDLEC